MNDRESTPNVLPWPPIIYLVAIALAAILNFLYPLPWIGEPLSDMLFAIGWLAIIGAIALYVSSTRAMKKANTTILPHRGSDHLVTRGAFSLSRNPIYLANTVIMIAIALITGVVWFILFGLIAAFATQKLAIEREEKHLELRFGKKYRDYRKSVRRWI